MAIVRVVNVDILGGGGHPLPAEPGTRPEPGPDSFPDFLPPGWACGDWPDRASGADDRSFPWS